MPDDEDLAGKRILFEVFGIAFLGCSSVGNDDAVGAAENLRHIRRIAFFLGTAYPDGDQQLLQIRNDLLGDPFVRQYRDLRMVGVDLLADGQQALFGIVCILKQHNAADEIVLFVRVIDKLNVG